MSTVYEQRGYVVQGAAVAKRIAREWLEAREVGQYDFGLPEVDDRYHIWRIPVLLPQSTERAGEVVVHARDASIDELRTASIDRIKAALGAEPQPRGNPETRQDRRARAVYQKAPTRRLLLHGDSRQALAELPAGSVDLVFTSPPYYNARPEYADYHTYEEYLSQIQEVIAASHRVLGEGRFFVMNVSAVLVRREHRTKASRRIAVPFDMHRLFMAEGFEFIDHILWEKPAGAGWATGRGRRFAADRNPLQYKAVPVTEDVLVYRKKSERLIDWNIRTYPDQEAVARSKIADGYEQTNIWRIHPANDKRHPAVFPEALAERVIRYFTFETDTVLDPYGGLGTTGRVAQRLGRGFVMVERDPSYFSAMCADVAAGKWGGLLGTPIEFACGSAVAPDSYCGACRPTLEAAA